jgi:hypothetical protein
MMDKFLKAVTKQFHTLFLRPATESAFHLFISHTDVHEGLRSFLEKGGSRVAPSLDGMAGVVRGEIRSNFSVASVAGREV